jgi:hypothetical protein
MAVFRRPGILDLFGTRTFGSLLIAEQVFKPAISRQAVRCTGKRKCVF